MSLWIRKFYPHGHYFSPIAVAIFDHSQLMSVIAEIRRVNKKDFALEYEKEL